MQSTQIEKICHACEETLYDGNPIKSFTKCRHLFHTRCLSSGSTTTATISCPVCLKTATPVLTPAQSGTPRDNNNSLRFRSVVDLSTDSIQNDPEGISFPPSSPKPQPFRSIVHQNTTYSFHSASSNDTFSPKLSMDFWNCPKCTYENKHHTHLCDICHQGRRPFELSTNLSNQSFNLTSRLVSSKQEKNSHCPEISSSVWSCIHCTYKNPETNETCEICEKSKEVFPKPNRSCDVDTNSRIEIESSEPESQDKTESFSLSLVRENPEAYDYEKDSQQKQTVQNNQRQSRHSPEVLFQPSQSPSHGELQSDDHQSSTITKNENENSVREQAEASSEESVRTDIVDQTSEKKAPSVLINKPSELRTQYRVFIPDLPMLESDDESEEILRQRLKSLTLSGSYDIRCYSSHGLAMIDVTTKHEYNHLIETVQSIVFDPQRNLIVHFVGDFQSDSFLVLPGNQEEKISTNDLLDRWQTILKVPISVSCNMISIDYPNIFKLTFPNFSQFLRTLHSDSFTFKNQIVHIYHRTSASFFDDLPPNITQNDIVTAIHTQLNRPLNALPVYVQFHPKTSTAVVIVSNSIVEWSQTKQISLNNKAYEKRQKLNLRLVISSFPADLSVDAVKQNVLFENRIIDSKQVGNRLILELDDQSIYEKCTQVGGVCVDGQLLRLQAFGEIHTETQNREMIMKRWYEQEMNRHKIDLKDFLDDLAKPFFKCCWNPKIWLEQFLSVCGVKDKESDNRRRLLRLTVMTDTIKVVNENRYQIENDGKSEDVQLNASKMKSIIYNNRSKLHSQREMSKPFDRPFPQTKVKVINKDCLLVYNDLAQKNKSPLLLNMANAETPGGGYRQGAGAQEENVFRRSNYHLSLDMEMDTKNEAERHWKTDNCDLKRVNRSEKIYPISEFGAIYTSGITVFRDTEENGYAYLPQPWIDVCAIAVAAYNRPDLHPDQQSITDKMAIGTRKKIENLFAIAHLHKHDCLVLSALGCGAFRNPPEHVVSIFQSVIEQFAGFFDEIHFAIVDDHNTGGSWNPKGNFAPFTRLDNFIVQPSDPELEANMIVGPFLILETKADRIKVNDVKIVDALLCQHGGHCHNQHDVEHNRKFAHPPLCSNYQKCQRFKDDKVHASSFIHRIECREGGMCKSMKDPQHQGRYTHPDFCTDQGNCENTKTEHLKKFCHVPVCSKGMTCTEHLKKSTNHCQQYRHIQLPCPYQSKCAHFHDQEHFTNYHHPFRQPCPLTPYTCEFYQLYLDQCANRSKTKDQEIEQHCLRFSHVCPFGRNCHDDDPSHLETSIHVHRLICPEKEKCSKLTDEEHLNSYTHPNIRDIRHLCHQSGAKCRDRWDRDHIRKYRHSGNSNHIGVAQYGALNIDTNFIRNHHKLADAVQKYTKNHKWTQPKSHVKEITDWIRSLQPVHRCNKLIFESILVHGHVMSRSYMDKLRNPRFVASAVNQHPQVRQIIDHHKNAALTQAAREFLQTFVAVEFDVCNATPHLVTPPVRPMGFGGMGPVSPSPSPASTSDDIDERKKALTTAESKVKPYIKESDLNKIRDQAKMIVDASIKLNTNKAGIGYKPDEDLGTNEQIFSIFGPHRGHYYGDIFIIFKREIMYHPDANFSVQAATSFGPSENAYKWRPWLTNPGNPKDRIQHYHWTKLHCAVPDYDYAAALELMALTSLDLRKETLNVTLDQVKQHWMRVDSHSVFESHLPQLVPLDYIDHVYIPKNIFESLSTVQQDAAKENFGDNLTITTHIVDMNNPHNLDATRTDYQKYVLDKIHRQITQNQPQEHYGFTVTLPASGLKQYVIMPMTILQSSYRHGASNDAIDTIYIYWQALGGGMTLALSKHKIVADEDQSKNESLLCHVADMVKVNLDHQYYESYSYLTVGYPLSHDILIGDTNLLKAKSNCFHRGCNTHDFITYCLILKRKIGQVVLLHVGSNGIYNHQKLDHKFRRDEIDLAELDYVQMSANNHPIPIRNLIIAHEPIDEFHTSFDKTSTSDQKVDAKSKPVATHPDKSEKDEKKSLFQGLLDFAKDAFGGAKDKKERKPCSESVNCLLQYASYGCDKHNKQYSHPCRYSEMCRSPDDHPHLEHIPHRVPTCKYNQTCRELTNPIHRAQYRHTGLADFLIPCRYEKRCRDTQTEHRQRYSHGENVLVFISSAKRPSIDDSDARSD